MSAPAPAANQEALDSTGNPIILGSIVAITLDIYPWDEYQALVVSLDSTECPEGGPIAVYFDREVDGHHFHPVTSRIPEWDAAHKAVTLDLLLSNQLWKRSPRVRHFLPTDLRVDAEWKSNRWLEGLFRTGNSITCMTSGRSPCSAASLAR